MRTRTMIIVAILMAACVLYLVFFGEQTTLRIESRYIGQKIPIVYKTPADLQESSISKATGKKLSYYGYEFEVPWDDLDESSTRVSPNRVVLSFRSGLRLMFYSGPPKAFVNAVLSSGQVDAQTLRDLYGNEVLESDYALTRSMLDSTPGEITFSTPRKNAAAAAMMITLKAIAVPPADTGIFSVHTKDFKGFQYGNPQRKPGRVLVDLFSDDGCLEFVFLPKRSTVNISQADVNRVLQTAAKVHSPGSLDNAACW